MFTLSNANLFHSIQLLYQDFSVVSSGSTYKEQVHEIFYPIFFTIPTHLDPLFIYWCIFAHGFNFAEIFPCGPSIYEIYELYELNLFMKRLNVLKFSFSSVLNVKKYITQTLHIHWHLRIKLCTAIDTIDSTVALTTLSLIPRCHWHSQVKILNR